MLLNGTRCKGVQGKVSIDKGRGGHRKSTCEEINSGPSVQGLNMEGRENIPAPWRKTAMAKGRCWLWKGPQVG